jgi:hypothetical protein
VKSLKLDKTRSHDVAAYERGMPMHAQRPIYNEQSWEADDTPRPLTSASRFNYNPAESRGAPCAYSVVAAQQGECLELRLAYATVKFSVSMIGTTSAYVYTACDSTLKLVSFVALFWANTEQNCAKWRATIADFSTPRADDIALLQWNNADYAATGQPAITEFAAPSHPVGWQEELVHNGLATGVGVAGAAARIGVALYALPEFPLLGLTQCAVPAKKTHMQVCAFTVRTLGSAQPSRVRAQRSDIVRIEHHTAAANKRARWG